LHLYFQILENEYFQQLGFQEDFYDARRKLFNRRAIRRAIEHIVAANRSRYGKLNPATATLRYNSLPDFARSFLMMIRNMDATKTEG
ncbi:MAG TPA: hypothetical protein PKE68_08760, partial [Saprospiraceae bacterium]|nr:hypothetical protein [Saprospiraceae bacterium]